MKLSACLVIHNEKKLLSSCLRSIKNVASEIIVVHDGLCQDKSLEVAREFQAKVFVRPYIGEAEFHRPFSYEKASGDWILQIDADEYLSQESAKKIGELIKSDNVDAYSFWWPYFYGKEYIKKGPFSQTFKPCLFRKSKMFMIGIAHEYPRTYGRLVKVQDIHLKHCFDDSKYTEQFFREKWTKWAKLQAKQIYNIASAPTFNISNLSQNPIYRYYQFMRRFPIISGILETLKYILIFIKRGILMSDRKSFKIAWFELRYLWLIRQYLLDLHYGRKIQ